MRLKTVRLSVHVIINGWSLRRRTEHILIPALFLATLFCGCREPKPKKVPAYANVAEALREKDLSAAKKLIKRGAGLNERCEIGWTALHYAVFYRHDEFITFLLKHEGIEVHACNKEGQTPLHLARSEHAGELLIKAGADVNARDLLGRTPLHWAVIHGKEIAEVLLKYGADFRAVDNKGRTALDVATARVLVNEARILVRSGAPINTLFTAVLVDDVPTARDFIENGASSNAKNWRGNTPLHYAAATGCVEMALMLIEKDADVNAVNNAGSSPLNYAVGGNKQAMVKLLLSKGVDPAGRETGVTTLHSAAQSGYTSIAQLLITHGVDVNIRSKIAGETPLHRTRDQDMAKLLISLGADVNAKADSGQTPLHNAAWHGDDEIVMLLVAEGANVNEKGANGRTPLHEAGLHGGKDTAELLIGFGAHVNARADNGWSPLHEAAYSGRVDVIELLIAKGAAVNVRDSNLETPLDIAIKRKKKEIIQLLRKHGAE